MFLNHAIEKLHDRPSGRKLCVQWRSQALSRWTVPQAVGVIETLGFPAVLAAADAMVKAGRVTIVYYGIAERGNMLVAIRGGVSEVKAAMDAGMDAAEKTFGGKVMVHYMIPNPPENVVAVLPIDFTDKDLPFRV